MALKNPFAQLVKSAVPRLDWFALYRGKVLGQAGNTVDVQPDDARLPAMSKVPLRHGLPGVSVTVQPGTSILVGWENGDPSRPYACLWEGGETVTSMTIGGTNGDAVATKKDLQALHYAIFSAGVTAMDGGATFKANIIAALTTAGWPTAAATGPVGQASSIVKAAR